MTTEEALCWVVRIAGGALEPYSASSHLGIDNMVLRTIWHCHGCNGEFVATWPKWEDEMIFPHEENCNYIATQLIYDAISKECAKC